jgi:hypothetical protein
MLHYVFTYRKGNKAIAMKRLVSACIIVTICFVTIFIGCKKSGVITYHGQGVITFSSGCCPGCYCAALYGGGYMIRFNSDTATLYHISNDMSKFGINVNSHFPIKVAADWQPDDTATGGNFIIITGLRTIN